MTVTGAGGDNHAVELTGLPEGVEDLDVLRLDVFECGYGDALQGLEFHADESLRED